MVLGEEIYQELSRMQERIDLAQAGVRGVGHWILEKVVGHCVVPPQLPRDVSDLLDELNGALKSLRSQMCQLDEMMRSPLQKFHRGYELTRQEYHLLCALGIFQEGHTKLWGLCDLDDYEAFSFLYYEDEEQRCYINPEMPTRQQLRESGTLMMRLGVPPEELRLDRLRPDQREFFRVKFPSVYERFSKTESPPSE